MVRRRWGLPRLPRTPSRAGQGRGGGRRRARRTARGRGAASRPAPARGPRRRASRSASGHRRAPDGDPRVGRPPGPAARQLRLGQPIYLAPGAGTTRSPGGMTRPSRAPGWPADHHRDGPVAGRIVGGSSTRAARRDPGPSPARRGHAHRLAADDGRLGYMLLRFVLGGGLRRQSAAGDQRLAVVLTHSTASTGSPLWALYLATSWLAVAWVAVALLLPVIGFGMATLIVWTSGTSRRPSGTSRVPAGTSAGPAGTSGQAPATSRAPARTSPAGAPGRVQAPEVDHQRHPPTPGHRRAARRPPARSTSSSRLPRPARDHHHPARPAHRPRRHLCREDIARCWWRWPAARKGTRHGLARLPEAQSLLIMIVVNKGRLPLTDLS